MANNYYTDGGEYCEFEPTRGNTLYDPQTIVLSVDIPCLYFMYVCKVSSDTRYVV